MERAVLQQLLVEADSGLYRGECAIARQRELIGSLERRGDDASVAKLSLRRLETRQARHIADRNRLFKQLADRTQAAADRG